MKLVSSPLYTTLGLAIVIFLVLWPSETRPDDLSDLLTINPKDWKTKCHQLRRAADGWSRSSLLISGQLDLGSLSKTEIDVFGIPIGFPITDSSRIKIDTYEDGAVLAVTTSDSQSAVFTLEHVEENLNLTSESPAASDRLYAALFEKPFSAIEIGIAGLNVTPRNILCGENSMKQDLITYYLLVMKGLMTTSANQIALNISAASWNGFALCMDSAPNFVLDVLIKKGEQIATGRLRMTGDCKSLSVSDIPVDPLSTDE